MTAGPHVVAVLVGPVICLLSMAEGAKRSVLPGAQLVRRVQFALAC